MAQSKDKKVIVANLTEEFKKANTLVFSDYRGMTAAELAQLRRELAKEGMDFKISKNTLARIAAKQANVEGVDDFMKGPVGIVISYKDPVAPAKVTAKFLKDAKKGSVVGGYMQGKALTLKEVERLANMPSRKQLLATIAATMNSPVSKLAYLIEALRKKKSEASA